VKIDFEKKYFTLLNENEENKNEMEFDLENIAMIEIKNINILNKKARTNDDNMEIGNELFIYI